MAMQIVHCIYWGANQSTDIECLLGYVFNKINTYYDVMINIMTFSIR